MPITKRPLCYNKPRGPSGPPVPSDFKSGVEPGVLKGILEKDMTKPIVIESKFLPIANYNEYVRTLKLHSHPQEIIDSITKNHDEHYMKYHDIEQKEKEPKPVYAKYIDDVGATFEEFVEWARNNNWNDKQIKQLYENKAEWDNSIEDRNNHLEGVFKKFSGKSSTSKPKVKPFRSRFKFKVPTIDIGEEEGEGDEVPDPKL